MNLVPFSDPQKVLSFVNGRGIRRRCAAGAVLSDSEVISSVMDTNLYLEALDGLESKGMVVLEPFGNDVEIHLCLKTIGKKTREVFAIAIRIGKACGFSRMLANFPINYRACLKLVNEFGFTDSSQPDLFWHKELKLN